MNHRLVGIALVLVASGSITAQDSPALPKDVPPLLGSAVVSDPGQGGVNSDWKIRLTVPKATWQVVGEIVPKSQWPQLKVKVEKITLTLRMDGPSQLVPSKIVNLKGIEIPRSELIKQLARERPVLVSVSGQMPDAYYLQLTSPDAMIVILGPRDGAPATELLPEEKRIPAPEPSPKQAS